ncbi:cilia- and flagella-associated protein 299 isoform X2 [Myripristis murdjan]|uniref:Cilia- and flagella-associated protein 299 n=1 Tax=Myripristis murdjan TaxID=586833 RepID=A0A667YLY0_9TELE|nr:cilia- and flagella-associated protein 299 isoform X2 [Myripristis murdjan]
MERKAKAAVEKYLTRFNTYEDYLDSKIKRRDLEYLSSREMARQMLEFGYMGCHVLNREEFDEKRAAGVAAEAKANAKTLASAGKELKDNFLKELAEREELNRNGKMVTVIFINGCNALGQEVLGYIDYAHRLKTEDFEEYFNGKKLMPRQSDILYINETTQTITSKSSPNYRVIFESNGDVTFKNRTDRTILYTDPRFSFRHKEDLKLAGWQTSISSSSTAV